ncbi:MAG: GerMN domain-containing protein [Clostridiaceae bacterium]|nr:GerMN domain-containing protein [Clostridiaceae bacterium]
MISKTEPDHPIFHQKLFRLTGVFCILFFLCFSVSGCEKESEKDYDGYYIFCLDTNETKVGQEKYTPEYQSGENLIDELIACMQDEPQDISLKKAIPDNVKIDEYTVNSTGDLSLYFSASYSNFTGVSEILRRAAIVKTLCQIPDVSSVEFYVAGQPLTDNNLNAIGFMTADSFLDITGENAYTQTTTLALYFADENGTSLVQLPVETTYDASIPLEQLVMEQLAAGIGQIKGTNTEKLQDTIPSGTKINTISVKEKICYLDLSSEFLDKRDGITGEVAIYSVVNSLTALPAINKVQFSIDGEKVLLYDDTINLGEVFECNYDLITNE